MVSKLRTVYRSNGILIGASPELFGWKSGHGDVDKDSDYTVKMAEPESSNMVRYLGRPYKALYRSSRFKSQIVGLDYITLPFKMKRTDSYHLYSKKKDFVFQKYSCDREHSTFRFS